MASKPVCVLRVCDRFHGSVHLDVRLIMHSLDSKERYVCAIKTIQPGHAGKCQKFVGFVSRALPLCGCQDFFLHFSLLSAVK